MDGVGAPGRRRSLPTYAILIPVAAPAGTARRCGRNASSLHFTPNGDGRRVGDPLLLGMLCAIVGVISPISRLKYTSWSPPLKLEIGGYDFEGPYDEYELADLPGVYVVLDMNSDGTPRSCIDVGESGKVATRIADHDREQCWEQNTEGRRAFAVLYTGDSDDDYRRAIEGQVRLSESPPCGES